MKQYTLLGYRLGTGKTGQLYAVLYLATTTPETGLTGARTAEVFAPKDFIPTLTPELVGATFQAVLYPQNGRMACAYISAC